MRRRVQALCRNAAPGALRLRPKTPSCATPSRTGRRAAAFAQYPGHRDGAYFDKGEDEIPGSGYVVHSLEAALWCFHTTNTYRDAILRAVNLGDDADTTAAVCGQIAGAYYGVQGIPAGWLDRLAMREEIDQLARGLRQNWVSADSGHSFPD